MALRNSALLIGGAGLLGTLALVMLSQPAKATPRGVPPALIARAEALLARPDTDPTLDPNELDALSDQIFSLEQQRDPQGRPVPTGLPPDAFAQTIPGQLQAKATRIRLLRGGAPPPPPPGPLPGGPGSIEVLRAQAVQLIAMANADPPVVDPITLDGLALQLRPLDPGLAAALEAKANEVRLKRGLPPVGVPAPEPLPATLPGAIVDQMAVLLVNPGANPDVVDGLANQIQIRFPGGFATQVAQLRQRARELRAAQPAIAGWVGQDITVRSLTVGDTNMLASPPWYGRRLGRQSPRTAAPMSQEASALRAAYENALARGNTGAARVLLAQYQAAVARQTTSTVSPGVDPRYYPDQGRKVVGRRQLEGYPDCFHDVYDDGSVGPIICFA